MSPNKTSKATSIEEVLLHLDDIIDECISANNYLCLFAYVYRATTAEIQNAILNGRFENPARMEKMDVIFASIYIDSYRVELLFENSQNDKNDSEKIGKIPQKTKI
jgi:hypothetical protein